MRNGNSEYNEEYSFGSSAFIFGALIGAGIALLLAPHTGAELRGILRTYASRAKDEATERGKAAWDTAVERGKEYYDKGQETMQDVKDSAREFAQSRGESSSQR